MHYLIGCPWPVRLTTNLMDKLMAAKIFPSLTYRCENLLDGSIKRITSTYETIITSFGPFH